MNPSSLLFSPLLSQRIQLLHYLEEFSNNLVSKTKALESQLDSLIFDAKATDVQVHDTFNEFLMLSNNQFIENVSFDSLYDR